VLEVFALLLDAAVVGFTSVSWRRLVPENVLGLSGASRNHEHTPFNDTACAAPAQLEYLRQQGRVCCASKQKAGNPEGVSA
jgi:hypothetical protein